MLLVSNKAPIVLSMAEIWPYDSKVKNYIFEAANKGCIEQYDELHKYVNDTSYYC